ncbi:UDP-N-acetylglucosamine-peptide N-acetylglucosaminyltransferase [Massilia antarctica]|uniref:UDP-N-acetylglucosamine-peptide N-acetylglucosaminyltransferase n=1 Tax=Massilia antarctica TaxID=2765360 RepID=A0AA49A9S6_9BURK|nr:hypothetical protein [Massilia antarctica]QPI51754.1 UDP-N-acetylglucosamine-peptide N-acetylglucosaminyltransferase [Massilia antarctica]
MNEIVEARQLVDQAWQRLEHWDSHIAAAQALLEHARATHPHDPQVLTCLGALLCDRARYHEADTVLREALAQGSPDRHTTFNLAVAVFNIGTRRQALALFGAAAKLQPSTITWAAYFDPHGT